MWKAQGLWDQQGREFGLGKLLATRARYSVPPLHTQVPVTDSVTVCLLSGHLVTQDMLGEVLLEDDQVAKGEGSGSGWLLVTQKTNPDNLQVSPRGQPSGCILGLAFPTWFRRGLPISL